MAEERVVSTDLHTQLAQAIRARLEVAKAADPGPWVVGREPNGGRVYVVEPRNFDWVGTVFAAQRSNQYRPTQNADHIAANDPATVIRMCERDLGVLARHADIGGQCAQCNRAHPCLEIRAMAIAHDLDPMAGQRECPLPCLVFRWMRAASWNLWPTHGHEMWTNARQCHQCNAERKADR